MLAYQAEKLDRVGRRMYGWQRGMREESGRVTVLQEEIAGKLNFAALWKAKVAGTVTLTSLFLGELSHPLQSVCMITLNLQHGWQKP